MEKGEEGESANSKAVNLLLGLARTLDRTELRSRIPALFSMPKSHEGRGKGRKEAVGLIDGRTAGGGQSSE